MTTYRIVRYWQRQPPEDGRAARSNLDRIGLTLEEAQRHCQDPETASATATSKAARRRTALYGPWFDGYVQEDNNNLELNRWQKEDLGREA